MNLTYPQHSTNSLDNRRVEGASSKAYREEEGSPCGEVCPLATFLVFLPSRPKTGGDSREGGRALLVPSQLRLEQWRNYERLLV